MAKNGGRSRRANDGENELKKKSYRLQKFVATVTVVSLLTGAVWGLWREFHDKRSVKAAIAVGPEFWLPNHVVADKVVAASNFVANVRNTGACDLHLSEVSVTVGNEAGGAVIDLKPEAGDFELKQGAEKKFSVRVEASAVRSYQNSGFTDVTFVVRDGVGVLAELHHCEKLLTLGLVGGYAESGKWIEQKIDLRP